ncbi:MAG: imidazole glycerol phosphate synthase subunit HisH [Deltaproteobacteria bacterium]|nr:imidazole glycerol phosphate synthase subunit HisH [Deltaproteobacteria bacterium]
MRGATVLIVNTSTANLASVISALSRAGATSRVTDNLSEIATAQAVVLPGVGTFSAAMTQLRARNLVEVLKTRILAKRPTLAICLGLQLLCETSEESPGEYGLSILSQCARRFPNSVSVPHLGWNMVEASSQCRLLQSGYAYFANSYRILEQPPGWNVAATTHGNTFVSAIESGAVLGCQFHPELSGDWGVSLLKRWLSSF